MLTSPVLLLQLAAHAWRHRSAPGARPFALQVLSVAIWAVGSTLKHVALDPEPLHLFCPPTVPRGHGGSVRHRLNCRLRSG